MSALAVIEIYSTTCPFSHFMHIVFQLGITSYIALYIKAGEKLNMHNSDTHILYRFTTPV